MPDITTAADLSTLLDLPFDPSDTLRAELLLDLIEDEVQSSVHYGLTESAADVVTLPGNWTGTLTLPLGPVSAVGEVQVDGTVVTDWTLVDNHLIRRRSTSSVVGWWAGPNVEIQVTYDHGYPATHRKVKAARGVVLRAAARAWANPEQRNAVTLESGYRFDGPSADGGTTYLTAGDLKTLTRAGLRKTYA